jgi:hypothetical protein
LDQISQQLKDQLEMVARGNSRGGDLIKPTLSAEGGNGR